MLAAAALAWPGAAFTDDAVDRTLAKPADGYVVELTITREGQSSRADSPNSQSVQWRFAPTRARLHLVNWVLGSDAWNPTEALAWLENWNQLVDQELARIQSVRQAPDPALNPMLAYADEDERVVRAAAARNDDVAVLLRLLHGIQYYRHVDDNAGETRQPVSVRPAISFDGGELVTHSRSEYGEQITTKVIPGWSPSDPRSPRMQSAAASIALVVWRFDPKDMARARELAGQSATIADEMTYRAENVRDDLVDKRIAYSWEYQAQYLHQFFRDAFQQALREVAGHAWMLTPKQPPAGLFAEGPGAQWWSGELAPDAPLSMPDVAGDRMVRLIMPVAGLDEEHLSTMDGRSRGSSRAEFDWSYKFPPAHLPPLVANRVRIHVSASPGTEHHFGFHHPWVMSEIDADVTGPRFAGEVSHIAEFEDSYTSSAGTKVVEEARETIRVQWTASYEPAPASPTEEPMILSFARPRDGKPVPFEAALDYGDAFYVEGRMEKPATREVYRIVMQAPDGAQHDVFLRPTEEDPTLLRSELLYVMWDVTQRGGTQ